MQLLHKTTQTVNVFCPEVHGYISADRYLRISTNFHGYVFVGSNGYGYR